MNDHEELIENLRYFAAACDRTNNGCQARLTLFEAADAIEQLVKERDAAVANIEEIASAYGDECLFCANCGDKPCAKCKWE